MKFSIVIINYNYEKTLERAIKSALEQDYPDIEVICVDDASTDRSPEIIESFKDTKNFIPVFHENNKSSNCSRLSGIEKASGDYVLFLDSDDMLMPNCCSTLSRILNGKKYDIVGFRTEVKYTVVRSADDKAYTADYFDLACGDMSGDQYRRAFYEERRLNHNMCNRCYSIDLAIKTAVAMHKDYIIASEDFYFNFIASHLMNSYTGIPDKLLIYTFGDGISTSACLSSEKLILLADSACNVLNRCREFINDKNLGAPYIKLVNLHEQEIVSHLIERAKFLPAPERDNALSAITAKFGAKRLIAALSYRYRYNPGRPMNCIDIKKLFPYSRKPIKTVALYYRRLYNGGTENVMSRMSYFLADAGYRVVVITDEEPNPLDYPLADGVKRICIGRGGYEQGTYAERYRRLIDCIHENEIDLFINNAYYSDIAAWDLCAVKSAGCAYMVFCHNIHTAGLMYGLDDIIGKQPVYRHAEGIIVLSAADRIFWSRINPTTFLVDNPLPQVGFSAGSNERAERELLWVGRLDDRNQKNPEDALEILYHVLQRVDGVTLRMCGYMDESTEKRLRGLADSLSINEHVFFEGYQKDLAPYYSRAKLMLMTSNYEGFSLAVGEGLSYGLPIVCYELPYMTMTKDSGAVISTPWRDTEAAAEAIAGILSDEDKWLEMSKNAGAEAEVFLSRDMPGMWKEIIDSVAEGRAASPKAPTEEEFMEYRAASELTYRQVIRVMAEMRADLHAAESTLSKIGTALAGSNAALAESNAALAESNAALAEADERLRSVYSSKRYRLGNALVYIPAKIKGGIWCLRHRGLRYTASLALKKAGNLIAKTKR